MFGLFKKRNKVVEPTYNYAKMGGVDMHSHILPGIDDGAKNVEESVALITDLMGLGINKFIATPHIMWDYYRNTAQTIDDALALLKAALAERQMDVHVEAAAEYFFDEYFVDLINKNQPLRTFGQNLVLIEFSFVSPPPVFIPHVQKLRDLGYKPVLAHPERYPYYTLAQYRNLKEWGFLLQLNTISLLGYYGAQARKTAEMLVENELVDFISSDAHHQRHTTAMKDALQMPVLQDMLQNRPLYNSLLV